ncbi:MAG: alpha/beta hydrolase [Gammaproteobacteria bacterium HGW-Gammaproteobacteria-8]|nr:MAG: alpha/beta hydrolase [Gammaproteobacteria bacterium HGW-Gammaproteobacteria-8]
MEAIRSLNNHEVRRRQIWTDDGVRLDVRYLGHERAPCVLLAHGFGQTQFAWAETARQLAAGGWQAVSYDARGHGYSDRAPSGRYVFEQFVEDFRRVCSSLPHPPLLIGASMGGLTALLAHSEKPTVDLKALVLLDIAPRWDDKGVEAMLAFMRQHPNGFSSLEQAREAVRTFLPHRRAYASAEGLKRNLRQGSDGRWYWHWDPAMLALAEKSKNLQSRLKSAARKLKKPTLLISGGKSELISDEHVQEFLKLAPHAEHVSVAESGHMVAGDFNDRFLQAAVPFLKSHTAEGEQK